MKENRTAPASPFRHVLNGIYRWAMKPNLVVAELVCVVVLTTAFSTKDKWTTLFDGKTISGWHSYQKPNVVGWSIEDGSLVPDGTGGDLVTDKEYENFDLEFEFKIPKGSNSGVVYKVIETPELRSTYMSGPEFQIIDDKGYLNEKGEIYPLKPTQLSGANYDMIPPADLNAVKPAGDWNKARIVVNNNHVEHFLNGKKVADYQYGSDEWKAMVAKSKFKDWAYATPHAKGKIALQNHNPREKVWFRNIRIKEL